MEFRAHSLWQFIHQVTQTPASEYGKLAKAFADDDLIRRKYVLSMTSKHFGKNKFEPAPLLNRKLLDVGAGTSSIPGELVLRGALVTALDINDAVIKTAKRLFDSKGMDVDYRAVSLHDFAADSNEKFDVVLCLDVLDYVKDAKTFVADVRKMVSDEGVVVLAGRSHNFFARVVYKFMQPFTSSTPHARRLKDVQQLFEAVGLLQRHRTGLSFNLQEKQWFKCETSRLRYMATFSAQEPASLLVHDDDDDV